MIVIKRGSTEEERDHVLYLFDCVLYVGTYWGLWSRETDSQVYDVLYRRLK